MSEGGGEDDASRLVRGALAAKFLLVTEKYLAPFEWPFGDAKKSALSLEFRKACPDIDDDILEFLLKWIGSSVASHEFGATRPFDKARALEKLKKLLAAMDGLLDSWADLRADDVLFECLCGDFQRGRLEEIRTPSPGNKYEWGRRVASTINDDLPTVRAHVADFVEAIKRSRVRTSPFRYSRIYELATIWNMGTLKVPTWSGNEDGNLSPFQRCLRILLSDGEARSDVARNTIRAWCSDHERRRAQGFGGLSREKEQSSTPTKGEKLAISLPVPPIRAEGKHEPPE